MDISHHDSATLSALTRRRCPACGLVESTAVCKCGVFKFPRVAVEVREATPAEYEQALFDSAYAGCATAETRLRFQAARNRARSA